MPDCKLTDEQARLAALHRYQIVDTGREAPFDKITALVKSVLRVPIAAVSLIDLDRQWFKSIQGLDASETSRDVAFCAHTIQQRAPLVIPDARLDPRFAANPLVQTPPFIRAYIGAPLETPEGYSVGSLCAIDTEPRIFDQHQAGILQSFAQLVVDELELRQVATTDALTGLMTRRGLMSEIDQEIGRARHYGRQAALVLFDIDHFKAINDTLGHPAGDAVLRAVARQCAGDIRIGDRIGRIGGEEFALLLPETPIEGAQVAAERHREAIAGLQVPYQDRCIRVTASFGICPLAGHIADAQGWLAEADQALYDAKRRGRNRCCTAPAYLTGRERPAHGSVSFSEIPDIQTLEREA
ncbi:diguanylate cyclase [Rhodovibrio sodomensis]|uniref:diguanylate cyclase n=1 Tax=Rhodovibrio sodomensis TaxID=1088 RepID=A0ABS1DDB5_9PROT|nr:sensor domain-containing diguanylate cyclase [Rhodovibrio sodomensis]MBK1667400.1 diguanylate cyclase [Rhodovibrio sodomensis]